jgi:dsRNA-specific ribonuclease
LFDGKTDKYDIEAIIDIRYEALLGAAYAKRYAKELAQWFELVEQSQFKDIDYAEMMKDGV